MRLLILFILFTILACELLVLVDAGCKGSKCKRKKGGANEDNNNNNDALSQVEDIEAKKADKKKSDEKESEEKDKKTSTEAPPKLRLRRIAKELKREREMGEGEDEEGDENGIFMVYGRNELSNDLERAKRPPKTHHSSYRPQLQQQQHNRRFAFRHHHSRRHVNGGHEHPQGHGHPPAHGQSEGEPVGDIKDANLWTTKDGGPSGSRRLIRRSLQKSNDGIFGDSFKNQQNDLDGFEEAARLFFRLIQFKSVETESSSNENDDLSRILNGNKNRHRFSHDAILSRKTRHLANGEKWGSQEEEIEGLQPTKTDALKQYIIRKKRIPIAVDDNDDENEANENGGDGAQRKVERRRYPNLAGGAAAARNLGPGGRERVLPLPVHHAGYPSETEQLDSPFKINQPAPNA